MTHLLPNAAFFFVSTLFPASFVEDRALWSEAVCSLASGSIPPLGLLFSSLCRVYHTSLPSDFLQSPRPLIVYIFFSSVVPFGLLKSF